MNYIKKYENFILIGDFNSEMCEDSMNDFGCLYNLKWLINKPTFFKSPDHPTCIVLTNKYRSLQNTSIIETGFHKLTVSILKMNYQKQIILYHRNYKHFDDSFRNDLLLAVHQQCIHFENIFLDTLNRHAPLKKRYIRANNAPFMTKSLCSAKTNL